MDRGLLGGVNTGTDGLGDVSKLWVVEKCGKGGLYDLWSSTAVSSEEKVLAGRPEWLFCSSSSNSTGKKDEMNNMEGRG